MSPSWARLPGTCERAARARREPGWPCWRRVYGWIRRWQKLGLFDALLRHVAALRRLAAGRRRELGLAVIDTQSVPCIPVRGPRGFDAAKKVLGRKRVALVDATGRGLRWPPCRLACRTTTACLR